MRDEFFCCVVDSGGSHSTKRWRDSARYMLLRYDNLNEAITIAASHAGGVNCKTKRGGHDEENESRSPL